jgi:hypothetical protein
VGIVVVVVVDPVVVGAAIVVGATPAVVVVVLVPAVLVPAVLVAADVRRLNGVVRFFGEAAHPAAIAVLHTNRNSRRDRLVIGIPRLGADGLVPIYRRRTPYP